MALTLVFNLIFLAISLSTTLPSFGFPIPTKSTLAFKPAKLDFPAKLDVSSTVSFLNLLLTHLLDRSNSYYDFFIYPAIKRIIINFFFDI